VCSCRKSQSVRHRFQARTSTLCSISPRAHPPKKFAFFCNHAFYGAASFPSVCADSPLVIVSYCFAYCYCLRFCVRTKSVSHTPFSSEYLSRSIKSDPYSLLSRIPICQRASFSLRLYLILMGRFIPRSFSFCSPTEFTPLPRWRVAPHFHPISISPSAHS